MLSYGEFAFFSVLMHAATLLQPLKTTLRVSPLYYDNGQLPGCAQWSQLLG